MKKTENILSCPVCTTTFPSKAMLLGIHLYLEIFAEASALQDPKLHMGAKSTLKDYALYLNCDLPFPSI
jgi:hypothetical protein